MSYVPHAQIPPLLPPPRLSRISFCNQDIHNGPLSPPSILHKPLPTGKPPQSPSKNSRCLSARASHPNPASISPPRPRRITSAEISVHLGITIKRLRGKHSGSSVQNTTLSPASNSSSSNPLPHPRSQHRRVLLTACHPHVCQSRHAKPRRPRILGRRAQKHASTEVTRERLGGEGPQWRSNSAQSLPPTTRTFDCQAHQTCRGRRWRARCPHPCLSACPA